jgi:hypothetical protein
MKTMITTNGFELDSDILNELNAKQIALFNYVTDKKEKVVISFLYGNGIEAIVSHINEMSVSMIDNFDSNK